jgi:hypothetical protein
MRSSVPAVVIALAIGCGPVDREPEPRPVVHCTPDEQAACTCPDGTQSVMMCQDDGVYGPCRCQAV